MTYVTGYGLVVWEGKNKRWKQPLLAGCRHSELESGTSCFVKGQELGLEIA
jgi:hypothetical protein